MRDRHDQAFIPKHLKGSPRSITGDTEQAYKIFF
jgi:hypothetical protein